MSGAIVDEVLASPGGDLAVVAASPWQLARRRLLRNRVALAMAALLAVIVALCLCAPLYAHHVAHTDPFRSNLEGTTLVNGKHVPVMVQSTAGPRPRRHADRADLGHPPLLPRRRRAGSRRRRPPALRRPQLAADRDRRCADHLLPRRPDRRRRRLLRRARRRRALTLPRPDLGVPRLPARDQPLDRADRARDLARAVPPRRPGACSCRSRSSASSTSRTSRGRCEARFCRSGAASSSKRRSGSARRTGGCSGATCSRT